jgi:GTP-binding protein EngB required for normal cell division
VVEKWQRLLKNYLSGRPNLRRAFVLIDSRHGIKPVDEGTTVFNSRDDKATAMPMAL